MVLQRAGHDLGGRGRAGIDQHDDRRIAQHIRRLGAEFQFGVIDPAFGINDQAAVQKQIRDSDGGVEYAARVVSEVQDQALETAFILGLEGFQHPAQVFGRVRLKTGDPHIAEAGFQHLAAHALVGDHGAGDAELKRRFLAFPENGQHDLAAWLAAHELDGVIQEHAFDRLVIQPDDHIAGLNAGPFRGGVVNGRDDPDKTVFHVDLNAQAAEFTRGPFLQILIRGLIQISGVRVQAREHAADRVFQQGAVVYGLHIIVFYLREHLAKGAQFIQRQRLAGAIRPALSPSRPGASQQQQH